MTQLPFDQTCGWCDEPATTMHQGTRCCETCIAGGPTHRVHQGLSRWLRSLQRQALTNTGARR
jgi:hypothetical protein